MSIVQVVDGHWDDDFCTREDSLVKTARYAPGNYTDYIKYGPPGSLPSPLDSVTAVTHMYIKSQPAVLDGLLVKFAGWKPNPVNMLATGQLYVYVYVLNQINTSAVYNKTILGYNMTISKEDILLLDTNNNLNLSVHELLQNKIAAAINSLKASIEKCKLKALEKFPQAESLGLKLVFADQDYPGMYYQTYYGPNVSYSGG